MNYFRTKLVVESIPDGYWVLEQSLTYADSHYGVVIAKKGFETDLASIPKCIRNIVDPSEPYIKEPAVIHDWIYRDHEGKRFNRKDADKVFYRGMRCNGINWLKAQIMYWAVRLFGGSSWKQ